jgi:hypothetical protein
MIDLDGFLRENSGHLLKNRTCGACAEWLVHRALGLDPGEHRIEWAEADVTDGAITLEVQSAAHGQVWEQEGLSVISVPIEQRVATADITMEVDHWLRAPQWQATKAAAPCRSRRREG